MTKKLKLWQKIGWYLHRHGLRAMVAHAIHELIYRPWKMLVFVVKCGFWVRHPVDVETDAFVRGARFMQIGSGFHAGPHMWLEAVDSYAAGEVVQSFTPSLVIGNNVSFSWYGHVGCTHHIEIGNDVLFGSRCYVTDHNHGIYSGRRQDGPDSIPVNRPLTENGEVIIGNRCWIGDNTVILPGVHIGEGSIIGANSVVTHDIPAASIAVGAPARLVKRWDVERGEWISTDI